MIVSFTGTRLGMVRPQLYRVEEVMKKLIVEVGVHGCADGGDRQFHMLVNPAPMHLYPCNEEQLQWAFRNCEGGKDVVHPYQDVPNYPLVRNIKMIDRAEATIAAPSGIHEIMRGSGTWQSIRHARKMNKYLLICWPDGRLTEENKP